MWRGILASAGVALLATGSAFAGDLRKAEDLFNRANYEGSLALLNMRTGDPATNFLIGRDLLMSGEFKKAAEYLERASNESPTNSEYVDWLGRAYGRRAEVSNPLLAASLASKARTAFEKSVQLDGNNRDALDDVFDFYLEAPGFLGGGYEKAAAVAEKLSAIDPGEGYYDEFKLDQKRKSFDTAEQHLRQAMMAAPHSIHHVLALARFLANQGRVAESDAMFAQAREQAPNNPVVWFAEADVLVKQKRNLSEARMLLTKYVQSPITSDDPPREDALRLLKQAGGA